jgi:hypothetical protein
MASVNQRKILKALNSMMKPIARMLLRSGIGFREFSEMAKAAYVHESLSGYGIRGRDTNMSRVAIMTGLSRREVRKIRASGIDELLVNSLAGPASQVLSLWFNDERFCYKKDEPRNLNIEDDENSFKALVMCIAGDIPFGAMKTELIRMGAVVLADDGRLRPIRKHYTPENLDERLEMALEEIIRPCLETLDNNCNPHRSGPLYYQSVAGIEGIEATHLPEIRMAMRDELSKFSSSMDGYLMGFNPKDGKYVSDIKAGIGVYYYDYRTSNT